MKREIPEPCTEEARAEGCRCGFTRIHATDIDPPDVKINRDCPLHGRDPDAERDA